MNDEARDRPDVIILPPILLLVTIAAGVIVDWLVPIGSSASMVQGGGIVSLARLR